jgi:hypothetical protein
MKQDADNILTNEQAREAKMLMRQQAIEAMRGKIDFSLLDKFDESSIGSLSEFMKEQCWSLIDKITIDDIEYDIIKHNDFNTYMVGNMAIAFAGMVEPRNRFDNIFSVELDNTSHNIDYEKIYRPSVHVKKDFRGRKIAKIMYQWLLHHEKYVLLGDEQHYFGNEKLWSLLSDEIDILVDIVDFKKNEILLTDVILHRGKYNEDFEKNLNIDENSLVRSILKNIET